MDFQGNPTVYLNEAMAANLAAAAHHVLLALSYLDPREFHVYHTGEGRLGGEDAQAIAHWVGAMETLSSTILKKNVQPKKTDSFNARRYLPAFGLTQLPPPDLSFVEYPHWDNTPFLYVFTRDMASAGENLREPISAQQGYALIHRATSLEVYVRTNAPSLVHLLDDVRAYVKG